MEAALVSAARSQGGASLEGLLDSAHPQLAEALNRPAASGVTALHVSVWRNHLGLVQRLLELGADPDITDHESGWSSVHSALHWGNLLVLVELLQRDGSLALCDWKGRTPVDLVSAELKEYLGPGPGDVFSWGNGNNYTLGTGSMAVQISPSRLESLHDAQVVLLSAAKFHSAAVSQDGKLYTFGWGRGGRLGHPEAHIHSGESAVITPRLVTGLGRRQVLAVAAAKHHTVFCTTAGEVYTMGSNRHGQLGYAVDTQPTPRRVGALRARIMTVAAANKHSVAVSAAGDTFTWGSNVLGQLGYGSSDSMSNVNPRLVEAMKGKRVVQAAAAKRHTVVLTGDGEVFTWGHRGVSPRLVRLAGTRDVLSASGEQLWFHRGHQDVFRPQAVAICAGAAHTSVLTRTGVVLCWRSADPNLVVQEVGGALAGKRVVSISAGKYRTGAVTDEGDVYMWEGRSDYFPAEGRQPGSGSKKAARDKGRPIPMAGAAAAHAVVGSLGHGSPSPAEVGSYGSCGRKGSYFDRFAREREAVGAQPSGLSLAGSAARLGPGATRAAGAQQGDAFAKILPERVEGLKRAVAVAVGEKHSLALQRWSAAQLPGLQHVPWLAAPAAAQCGGESMLEEEAAYQRAADSLALGTPRGSDLDSEASGLESVLSSPERLASPSRPVPRRLREPEALGVPSLQRICEEEVARQLVDPRTTLQVLEYADVAGADLLRAYCLAVAVCNLDAVLLEARGALEQLPPHLLAELERLWKLRLAGGEASSAVGQQPAEAGGRAAADMAHAAARARARALEPAGPEEHERGEEAESAPPMRRLGSRLQPGARPTAAPPHLGSDDLEHEAQLEVGLAHASPSKLVLPTAEGESSFKDKLALHAEAEARRMLRALLKKLQQIDSLEQRAAEGAVLDAQQRAKLAQRPIFRSALAALEGGAAVDEVQIILKAAAIDREEAAACPSPAPAAAGGSAAAVAGASSSKKASRAAAKRATPAKEAPAASAALLPPLAAAAPAPAETPASLAAGPSASSLAPDTSGSSFSMAGPAAQGAGQLSLEDSSGLFGTSPTATVPAFGPLGHAAEARSPSEPGTQVVGGFRGLEGPPSAERPKSAKSKDKDKAKRKGGLSMFLRGDLERAAAPPPVAAAAASPAWGARPAAPAATTSLKDILSQEAAAAVPTSASKAAPSSASKGACTPGSARAARSASAGQESPGPAAGGLRMSLASFMVTSPLAIQRSGGSGSAKGPPPPAWGGTAGASPPAVSQSNFRLIQEEQQQAAAARSFGTSPPATHPIHRHSGGGAALPPWRPPAAPAAAGAGAGPSTGVPGTSPSGSGLLGTSPSGRTFSAARAPQQSKWYVPEERNIKSIRSIQTEETAVKELSKLYGAANVRIVPRERKAPGLPPPAAKH